MARHLLRGAAVMAGAAVLLWLGVGRGQAQVSYPSGYDPLSGWTWEEDFRYMGGLNPFGQRQVYQPSYLRSGAYYAPAYGSVWSPTTGYSYGAYAPSAPARDDAARIRVVVPRDAKVWFGNSATEESGRVRLFESPRLTPGREYTYDVKAQWRDENGKEVTRTQHVDVRANALATVDFTRPDAGENGTAR